MRRTWVIASAGSAALALALVGGVTAVSLQGQGDGIVQTAEPTSAEAGTPAPGSTPPKTAAPGEGVDWNSELASCLQTGKETAYDGACLERTWTKAYETGELRQLQDILRAVQEEDPLLAQECHGPGHRAGFAAYKKDKDLRKVLGKALLEKFACNNGFLHGAMMGTKLAADPEKELETAFEICAQAPGYARINCTDGTGHAVWQLVHDEEKALGLCELYKDDQDAANCYGSSLEQMFVPDADKSRPAKYAQADAYKVMPDICLRIKGKARPAVLYTCNAIGGSLMLDEARDMTLAYVQKEKGGASAADASSYEEVKKEWKTVFERCHLFAPSGGESACKRGIAASVIWFARYDDIRSGICDEFKESEWYRECMSVKAA